MIEPLPRSHDREGFDREGFDCGEPSLNRFLRKTVRQYADRDFGITCVAVPEVGS